MHFADPSYFIFLKPRSGIILYAIYTTLLVLIIASMACLPLIKTDITMKTHGITRPQNERTEIKTAIPGIIDTLFYKEGQQVEKNQVILRIKDLTTGDKQTHNRFEIGQRSQFIHDLILLTTVVPVEQAIAQLQSALYRDQLNHFLHQKTEQDILLKKANKEVEINASLAKNSVISAKEFFDVQNTLEKLIAQSKTFVQARLSNWQQDLERYRLEVSQLNLQMNQVRSNAGYYEVRSSVSGIIQGIATRYSGSSIQANETICTISPGGSIIGECLVQTKDIGLLKINQPVRYRIDAFDYNYFGVLTGKVISIDNDFTAVDNKPLFKVYCSFDSTQLYLKNGFAGQLKKGLSFQASFTVARRSLWQLLFDKLDDWLNPNATGIH